MRVALTHPEPRVGAVAAALSAHGHDICELPFSRIESLCHTPEAALALSRLHCHAAVVFVSPSAIDVLATALTSPWPSQVAVAVIGPGSADALTAAGMVGPGLHLIKPSRPPYDAKALAAEPAMRALAGRSVLLVHGQGASDALAAMLMHIGIKVERLSAYRSVPCEPAAGGVQRFEVWLQAPQPVAIVFTTVSAVLALQAWADTRGLSDRIHRCRALAIHPRIVQALQTQGWADVRLLAPGMAPLVGALESSS